jgi:transposase, IS30 family
MTDETQKTVTDYLLQKWSPEQIAGYLKTQGGEWVSHETIYQFVLEYKKNGGELYKQLRHSVKKRKKCYGGTDRRGKIKDRISIDERPKSIEKRTRIGGWEIYLVIGKSHKGDL